MKNAIALGLTGLLALGGGIGIGAATVEPEIVTKTKEVEVIKEVEVPGPEVEVEVTPEICLDAIDSADAALATITSVFEALQTGLGPGSSRIGSLTEDLGPQMDDYHSQSLECYLS